MIGRLSKFRKRLCWSKPQVPSGVWAASFLLAAPRSGTTWILRALACHPEIFPSENRLFGEYFDVIQDHGSPSPRLRVTLDAYVDAVLAHYQWQSTGRSRKAVRDLLLCELTYSIFDASHRISGKKVIVDKITPYIGTSGKVSECLDVYFPDSKLIVLKRDGRDVVTSGVFHWLSKTRVGATSAEPVRLRRNFFLRPSHQEPLKRFFSDDELRHWARTWTEPLQAAERLRGSRPSLRLSYESMLSDQADVLARVFRFLGVDDDPAIVRECVAQSSFEAMSGGRKRGDEDPSAHVRKGVVGDWTNYFTRRDGQIFSEVAGSMLIALGYETNDSWIQRLPDSLNLCQPAPQGAACR